MLIIVWNFISGHANKYRNTPAKQEEKKKTDKKDKKDKDAEEEERNNLSIDYVKYLDLKHKVKNNVLNLINNLTKHMLIGSQTKSRRISNSWWRVLAMAFENTKL